MVDADEIVVLEAGRVADRGAHADLIKRPGPYRLMWERQQEAADPAPVEASAAAE